MDDAGSWASGVDTSRPSAARMYDFMLGGSHNFAVDRAAAEKVLEVMPGVRHMAQANRAWLHRVVRHIAGTGVRQFLDVGSGIPTRGNVHEIARRSIPDAAVVYVDIDPVAVIHSNNLLRGDPYAVAIEADLRDPATLLTNPRLHGLLDLSQPVALLLASVLHFIPGEAAYQVVSTLSDALAPGSVLAISHATPESFSQADQDNLASVYGRSTTPGGQVRTRTEVSRFFDGYTLVEPGLVWLSQWRPDDLDDSGAVEDPAGSGLLAAAGRKQ